MEHLRALVGLAVEAAESAGADADVRHAVRLAVEEVCTNVIEHGYGGSGAGPIAIDVDVSEGEIVIRITDDAPVLDLDAVARPDTTASVEDRPIGGFGWHFVRSVMDRVEQQAVGDTGNVFVLAKRYTGRDDGLG
jgi:anti-sigma regulatory factor (Ser/Thr protein kinase)